MTLGIMSHTQNATAVASPNVIREQTPEFKNTPKDCSTTVPPIPTLSVPNTPHRWAR